MFCINIFTWTIERLRNSKSKNTQITFFQYDRSRFKRYYELFNDSNIVDLILIKKRKETTYTVFLLIFVIIDVIKRSMLTKVMCIRYNSAGIFIVPVHTLTRRCFHQKQLFPQILLPQQTNLTPQMTEQKWRKKYCESHH